MTPAGKVFVTGAGRCGECHEKMYDEWEASGHAKAATSDVYKKAVADANGDATCNACHAPLAKVPGIPAIALEGVTCDVCHTLRDPKPAATGAGFRLAVDDMIKFGPRCDLDDHYFHRMGCSEEHREAVICGACHWWEPNGLPVLTEFADWRDGPSAATPCQDCHMPGSKAPLAVGAAVRQGVPHHGWLGAAGDLRQRAFELSVSAAEVEGRADVTVVLTNLSGHGVPGGLPERRVRVVVRWPGDVRAEELLGRALVDGTGVEAPFWRATKLARDTRIKPGEAWSKTFPGAPVGKGEIVVEVWYESMSMALADKLGAPAPEKVLMTSAKLSANRLPKSVTVKPKAAKRGAKR